MRNSRLLTRVVVGALLCTAASTAVAQRATMAVLEFENRAGISRSEALVLLTMTQTELFKYNKFNIVDRSRLDEAAIANLGIGRKFQRPTVFESHTVFDNLELALKGGRGVFASLFSRLDGAKRDRIGEVMEIIALTDHARRPAGALSHGQKQWLEIGMLLMQDPEFLMVDEPVAGMSREDLLREAPDQADGQVRVAWTRPGADG